MRVALKKAKVELEGVLNRPLKLREVKTFSSKSRTKTLLSDKGIDHNLPKREIRILVNHHEFTMEELQKCNIENISNIGHDGKSNIKKPSKSLEKSITISSPATSQKIYDHVEKKLLSDN